MKGKGNGMGTQAAPDNGLFEFQKQILREEIKYIQLLISHYDDLAFKIKGWAVTIWSGAVAFGAKERSPIIISTSIFAILAFWILDTYFKQYQRRSINRMAVIEMFLNSRDYFNECGLKVAFGAQDFGQFPIHDPISRQTKNLHKSFEGRYRRSANYWECFFVPNVLYFYLMLLLGATVIICLLLKVQ